MDFDFINIRILDQCLKILQKQEPFEVFPDRTPAQNT